MSNGHYCGVVRASMVYYVVSHVHVLDIKTAAYVSEMLDGLEVALSKSRYCNVSVARYCTIIISNESYGLISIALK
jgi:hypothetical protein